jgi:hypothetical protein
MAGVAGPMMRWERAAAARFLVGFSIGAVAAGLVLALVALLLGRALNALVPDDARAALVAAICVLFGVADLLNRTPHVWRQVPQALVRVLPPGFLGVVWGFDIGLLFTTQKAVSLMWAAVAAVVLLHPAAAPALLVGMALVSSTTIVVWSVSGAAVLRSHGTRRDRRWLRAMRTGSGSLLLALGVLTVVQTFQI